MSEAAERIGACHSAAYSQVYVDRFWSVVEKGDGAGACWEMSRKPHIAGYCRLWVNGRFVRAHRFSYELHFGAIPDGLLVCHRCDNRKCVRPDHLFLGTQADNMRDMHAKGRSRKPKTHCINGHEFTAENTYFRKTGGRKCKTCHNQESRELRRRAGAA